MCFLRLSYILKKYSRENLVLSGQFFASPDKQSSTLFRIVAMSIPLGVLDHTDEGNTLVPNIGNRLPGDAA